MNDGRRKSPGTAVPLASLAVAGLAIASLIGLQLGLIKSPFNNAAAPKTTTVANAKPETKKLKKATKAKPGPSPVEILEEESFGFKEKAAEVPPVAKAEPTKFPARLAYEKKAEAQEDTPESQAGLAHWCEENQLADEARGHWEAVKRLAPDHPMANQKLGFKKKGKAWMTDAMVAEKAAQEKANSQWRDRLSILHERMHNRGKDSDAVAAKAVAEVLQVDDVRAAPMLWDVFGRHPRHHLLVAQELAKLKSPKSSLILAAVAAYSPDEKARTASVDELKGRDPTEFSEPLIALLGPELKHRRIKLPPQPGVPSLPALEVENERFVRQFVYFAAAPPADLTSEAFGDCSAMTRWANFGWTSEGKALAREMNKAEAQAAREAAEAQIRSDIAAVNALNDRIRSMNDRVHSILTETTSNDFGLDRNGWNAWLAGKLGRKYIPPKQLAKVQFQDFVQPIYQPSFVAIPPTPS